MMDIEERIADKTAELYPKANTIPHLIDMVKEEIPIAMERQIRLCALGCDAMIGHYFDVENKQLVYKGGLK